MVLADRLDKRAEGRSIPGRGKVRRTGRLKRRKRRRRVPNAVLLYFAVIHSWKKWGMVKNSDSDQSDGEMEAVYGYKGNMLFWEQKGSPGRQYHCPMAGYGP